MFKKRGIIFGVLILFFLGFIYAAEVENSLHLTIQTTNATGVTRGTFAFVFNLSNSSDCANVVYSDLATLTTDSRGIISYYLENVILDFSVQYWLCYYRDGILINATKLAKSPYAFATKNVSTSGINPDSNFNLGSYNVTANYFVGDGSQLTNLPVSSLETDPIWTGEKTNYLNTTNILSFGFYNSTNFDINNYYLASNPFGFYNSTTLPNLNLSGLIKDWNSSSLIRDWNSTGLIRNWAFAETLWNANYSNFLTVSGWNNTGLIQDWNSSSLIRDWNSTGLIRNWAFAEDLWNANYSTFLTHIDWSKVVNGTLALASNIPTNNNQLANGFGFYNSTDFLIANYYLASNPFGFYNSTTLPTTANVWNRSSTNVFLANTGDNVGIGTDSPTAKLDIVDTSSLPIRITDDTSPTWILQKRRSDNTQLTGLYEPSLGKLSLMTLNLSRLTIDSDGKVGIGTINPQANLHVDNAANIATTLRLSGANNLVGLNITANGGVGHSYIDSTINDASYNMYFRLRTLGTPVDALTLLGTGNVGIGTTNPTAKFVVSQGDSNIEMGYSAGLNGMYVQPYNRTLGAGANLSFYATENAEFKFYTNSSQRLTIASSGNVGIGTANPTSKLQVNAPIDTTNHQFKVLSAGTSANNKIALIGITGLTNGFTMTQDASSNVVYAFENGNVGIGTIAPTLGLLQLTKTSGNDVDLALDQDSVASWRIRNVATTGDLGFYSGTLGQVVMTLNRSSGYVGIGTTTPQNKLNVVGDLNVTGTIYGTVSSSNQYWNRSSTNVFLANTGDNVGIGTTAPASDNSIAKFLHIGSSSDSSAGIVLQDNENKWELFNDGHFYIKEGVTTRMIIDLTGEVGIGTDSPTQKLEVNGNTSIYPTYDPTSIGNARQLLIGESTNNVLYKMALGYVYLDGYWGGVVQSTHAGSGSRLLLNPSGGNVGIGTTSPSFQLTQNKSFPASFTNAVGDYGYMLQSSGTNILGFAAQTTNPTAFINTNNGYALSLNVEGQNGRGIYIQNTTGNVGIGTTEPSDKLTIRLGVNSDRDLEFKSLSALPSAQGQSYIGITTGDGSGAFAEAGNLIISARTSLARNVILNPTTGNVGIGTTSPEAQLSLGNWNGGNAGTTGSSQLEISGTHNIGVNAGGVKLNITGYDNDGEVVYPIYSADENGFVDFFIKNKPISTGSSTAYFQGNVGIGTTTPQVKAVVTGSSSEQGDSNGIFYVTDGTGVNTDHKLQMGIVSNSYAWIQSVKPGTDAKPLVLNPSGGNVGIGTTSPTTKLDITSSSAIPFVAYLSEKTAVQTYTNLAGLQLSSYQSEAGAPYTKLADIVANADAGAAAALRFLVTPTGGIPTEAVRINKDGNVGIGTTSPTSKLEVAKETGKNELNVSGMLYVNSTSQRVGIGTSSPISSLDINTSNTPTIHLETYPAYGVGNNRRLGLFPDGASESSIFGIYNEDYGRIDFSIKDSGRVGIGTANPTSQLTVNGTTNVMGNLNVSNGGNITVSGCITFSTGGQICGA